MKAMAWIAALFFGLVMWAGSHFFRLPFDDMDVSCAERHDFSGFVEAVDQHRHATSNALTALLDFMQRNDMRVRTILQGARSVDDDAITIVIVPQTGNSKCLLLDGWYVHEPVYRISLDADMTRPTVKEAW